MIILQGKNKLKHVKIRLDGADKNGKNTTNQITVVADGGIEEVYKIILEALRMSEGAQES